MPNNTEQQNNGLLPFVVYPRNDMPKSLPFRPSDYLELVDCSGRIMCEDRFLNSYRISCSAWRWIWIRDIFCI